MKETIKGYRNLKAINKEKKICLMGIGNLDKADDYAGMAVIEKIEKENLPKNLTIIKAGSAPEAYTNVIKKIKPDILVIIDTALMNERPGTIKCFLENDLETTYVATSHNVSLGMLTKYLRHFLKNLITIFIGIEPKKLNYMENISQTVQESVNFLSGYLLDFLRE